MDSVSLFFELEAVYTPAWFLGMLIAMLTVREQLLSMQALMSHYDRQPFISRLDKLCTLPLQGGMPPCVFTLHVGTWQNASW